MDALPIYSDRAELVGSGWQRQAESSELADGLHVHVRAIGKLRLPLPPISLE